MRLQAALIAAAMLLAGAMTTYAQDMPAHDLYEETYAQEQSAETDDDIRDLIPDYEAAAAAGNAQAMGRLARIAKRFDDRNGMYIWARKAAEVGDAEAQYYFASVLRQEKDCGESRQWLIRSAEQGLEKAIGALANFYEYGTCGSKDFPKAVYWYEKAARMGSGVAQNNLGYMYMRGRGVQKDLVTAYAWLRIASQQIGEPQSYVNWSPRDSWAFVGELYNKLSDDQYARARQMARQLCTEDQVCSRVPEDRQKPILSPPARRP